MKNRSLLFAFLPAVALAVAFPTGAAAQHGSWIAPDNADQYISGDSLTARGVIARNRGKAQLERTEITTYFGNNDIDVRDAYYGLTGWLGQTVCVKQTLTGKCDVFTVHLNESTIPADDYWWQWVGCHEFGHTGGLNHRPYPSGDTDNNSCMHMDNGSQAPGRFDAHDIAAINSRV